MRYIVYIREWSFRRSHEFKETYSYVTDSQEIRHILNMVGLEHKANDITAMFVLVGDGEYKEIWLTDNSKPYIINCPYYRIVSYYRS